MEKKKRRSLRNLLTIVFTCAIVMTFAGLIDKIVVNAAEDSICKVTVIVKDKETGNVINDATVIFTEYYRNSETQTYPEVKVTQNADGTYNVPYDSEYGTYYRYYAKARGYKDSTTLDSTGVPYGKKLTVESQEMNAGVILLEKYPASTRFLDAIGDAENEINNYVDTNDYDSGQVLEIEQIKNTYLDKIHTIFESVDASEVTDDEVDKIISQLDDIVAEAKAELDKVATSQDNLNETYINMISFTTNTGERRDFSRREDEKTGKFEINLSLFDKGGMFSVTGNDPDTSVTWQAKQELYYEGYGRQPFEVIDNTYVKGKFLNQGVSPAAIPIAATLETGTVDCTVTFTKDGNETTVTFVLNILPRHINDVTVNCPEQVTLTRDENLNYNAVVTTVTSADETDKGYMVTIDTDDSSFNNYNIESKTPDVAIVNDDKEIIPSKAGKAEFEVTVAGYDDPVSFEIEFLLSDEEKQEIVDAAKVENLIAALGTITLDKEANINAAKAAYVSLSDNAKKKVSAESLKTLETAQTTLTTLKEEAAKKAAEEEAAKKAASATTATSATKQTTSTVKLSKVALKVKAGKKKVKLTWKKSSKASGYIIYRATKKNGKYKQIKVIKSWKKTTFTDKKVKSKKTYFYKIRPYKGKVKGPVSAAKKVKVK